MSIVPQAGRDDSDAALRPIPVGSVAVCYRCSHAEPTAARRCPRCGFALIFESTGRPSALPARDSARVVPLPGMTSSKGTSEARRHRASTTAPTLPRLSAAAQEAGAAAAIRSPEPGRSKQGWLGKLRRLAFRTALCVSAIGAGAGLAASIT